MSLTQWFTRAWPDGVVAVGLDGDLDLRADAVGARDEHGLVTPDGTRNIPPKPPNAPRMPAVRVDSTSRLIRAFGVIGRLDVDARASR